MELLVYKMRYLIFLLLLGVFTTRAFCRPQNVEESEGDEAEYESDGAEVDDAIEEEEDSRIPREESSIDDESGQSHMQESNRNTNLQRVEDKLSKTNDNLSRYNPSIKSEDEAFDKSKSNNEYPSSSEQRDTSRFMAKNLVDQPENKQFSNRDDSYKSLRDDKIPVDKHAQAVSNEGEVLFERNNNQQGRQERTNKNDYGRSASANSQFRYSNQFYNSMQEGAPDRYSKTNLDRDRRAAQDTKENIETVSTVLNEPMNIAAAANAAAAASAAAAPSNAVTVNSVSVDAISNVAEDEEAAIKRHVKKLSAEELEELLNSLSEDKRQLLKKIMDSDTDANNDINKREITKKAGAAPDDNSYLEGGRSDASKLVSDTNSQNSATESTDMINKQQNSQSSDISVLPVNTKSSDASNDTAFTSLFSEKKVDTPNPMDTNNQAAIKSNNLSPDQSKTNKREVGSDQLSNIQNSYDSSAIDEDHERLADLSGFGYFSPQDKDSDFDNDQSEFYNKDGNSLKREISEKDNDDSDAMKSLAESFPNSNSYDDNDSGSNSAPLIRVKRKNLDVSVKKRSANIMPDAKVAYFPYRAENEDEDNDEGNEFDDEGFYNPTSNLLKNDVKDTISDDGPPNSSQDSPLNQSPDDAQAGSTVINPKPNNKLESETANLGSDTDSVLSGGEGIDENLMFNSASRNKRASKVEGSNRDDDFAESPMKEQNRLPRSTVLDDEINSVTENFVNDANYHEKEPFHLLSGNYELDSGRYKRIRAVKQPLAYNNARN